MSGTPKKLRLAVDNTPEGEVKRQKWRADKARQRKPNRVLYLRVPATKRQIGEMISRRDLDDSSLGESDKSICDAATAVVVRWLRVNYGKP